MNKSKPPNHLTLADITQLDAICNRMREKIDERQRLADDYRYDKEQTFRRLQNFTRDLLDTGIAVIPMGLADECRTIAVDIHRFAFSIQKQTNRPYVLMQPTDLYVSHRSFYSIWSLQVARTKPMEVIIAPLLLVSLSIDGLDGSDNDHDRVRKAMVMHKATDKEWTFYFTEGDGEDIRRGWLETCRRDNLCRYHLRLPPRPVSQEEIRALTGSGNVRGNEDDNNGDSNGG